MISKLVRGCLILALVVPMVRAQSVSPEASAAEKKKARAELDKKTVALVDEIIKELQSLTLPENRIRISIGLAGSLWPRDEKRARSLFKEATASLNEMMAGVDRENFEYEAQAQLIQQLRQEMVQIAASHDPRLAVDFLRASRMDSTDQPPNSGLTNLEAQLEMRAAMQIAPKDPNEALGLARESLKISLDYSALDLLYNLHSQQKAVAERFLDDILKAIRTYGIGNSSATPVAINLLRTWSENNRAIKEPAAPRTTNNLALSNLNEATARELSTMIFDALLSDAPTRVVTAYGRRYLDGPATLYPGMIQGMFQQIKPVLPDIEGFAPDRMTALRTRMAEFEKTYEAQQGPWGKYQELSQNGTPDALMEAAKTAPAEVANGLVQQAAWKAINQGDDAQAGRIIEQIADPRQRTEMKRQLARQAFSRAGEQKKLAEARGLLPRLPLEEQVGLLAQLAASCALQGDKPAAFQLLGEAESLIPGRALGYGQLQALISIANTYASLDVGKSTGIIERVIDQVNELVTAALVLNGFDVQGYFRNGEFIITGGNPLSNMAYECGRVLASSANRDFDRARSSAERFQRPEMRLIALSQIAQGLLTSSDQ
jgi:hypothetical protein